MWMSKNGNFYFQTSGHHGVPINGTQVLLKEIKQWFAIFHLCFYYWLAIALTCIAISDAILNKMFPGVSIWYRIIVVPECGMMCVSWAKVSWVCFFSQTFMMRWVGPTELRSREMLQYAQPRPKTDVVLEGFTINRTVTWWLPNTDILGLETSAYVDR